VLISTSGCTKRTSARTRARSVEDVDIASAETNARAPVQRANANASTVVPPNDAHARATADARAIPSIIARMIVRIDREARARARRREFPRMSSMSCIFSTPSKGFVPIS